MRIIGTGRPAVWQDKRSAEGGRAMTSRSQPTAKSLTVNRLRLRYLEWGSPGALPVVCVHGYTSSAEAFNAVARRLEHRAHLIAMDVRGHGERAWAHVGD